MGSTETLEMPSVDISAWVPDSSFAEEYVGRKMKGGRTDIEVLWAAHACKYNVLLEGPTGSAKTSLAMAYAATRELPLVVVQCNGGAEPRQLLGGWVPKPDGSFGFSPGALTLGVSQGAVILLNELNFLPPKVAVVLFGLLDLRRTIYLPDAQGSEWPTFIQAHEDTFVMADMNPGYEGTRVLNKALRNRFAIKIPWGYDAEVESNLVPSRALIELAEKMRGNSSGGEKINAPVSTNMLLEFCDIATATDQNDKPAFGWDFAVDNFLSAYTGQDREVAEKLIELHADAIQNDLGVDDSFRYDA